MDVYPQVCDSQQTLTLEPLIGHARLGGQRAGEPPRSFSTRADRYLVPLVVSLEETGTLPVDFLLILFVWRVHSTI
jgi:hypothetical protein